MTIDRNEPDAEAPDMGWIRSYFRGILAPVHDEKNEDLVKMLEVSSRIDERVERLEKRFDEHIETTASNHGQLAAAIEDIARVMQ